MSRAIVCDNCHSVFRGPATYRQTVEFVTRVNGTRFDFCSSNCQRRWFEHREHGAAFFEKDGHAVSWGIRCEDCGATGSSIDKEGWSFFKEEYLYGWRCPKEIIWLLARGIEPARADLFDSYDGWGHTVVHDIHLPEKGYGEMPEPPGLWAKTKKKVKR